MSFHMKPILKFLFPVLLVGAAGVALGLPRTVEERADGGPAPEEDDERPAPDPEHRSA